MRQAMVRVPAFEAAQGPMGAAQMSHLLPALGLDREMIQYFKKTGKMMIPGKNITDKNIETITATSESINRSLFDTKNLLSDSIAEPLGYLKPIFECVTIIADAAGGFANLRHPLTAVETWAKYGMSGVASLGYMTQDEAKKQAAARLAHAAHPASSSWQAGIAGMIKASGQRSWGDFNSETNVTINGSADVGTVNKMARMLGDRDRKKASHYGMLAGVLNPTEAGQLEGGYK
jgi:hypothetical protein